jgi:hypothetical protein
MACPACSFTKQGQGQEGLRQVRHAITALQDTEAARFVPYFCVMLADVIAHLGHTPGGLQALAGPTP